jgi:hypothetical protein
MFGPHESISVLEGPITHRKTKRAGQHLVSYNVAQKPTAVHDHLVGPNESPRTFPVFADPSDRWLFVRTAEAMLNLGLSIGF